MGKILLPWVDRIDGGKYTFRGADYETPISEHWNNSAIHGLALFLPWTPVRHRRDRLVLEWVLYPQYGCPFTLRFQTEYVLNRSGLSVRPARRSPRLPSGSLVVHRRLRPATSTVSGHD
ncbi:hypothetical protein E1263_07135 [Kribbella antibiotica]|uniref:Uncharacterized protein n=1 Tax=Kribbella antibiotica TaxID=190195 RepID=A0A4R4ZR73_9ACTN|nr:hypothetical protein [Kribbella antibiotica]TDD61471.1 hypothetical protein E1263_07135 [Kribbella antibiotica]